MRVKMKESMPVTVDGVATLDLEAGETYEVGDAVGADLVESGKAVADESHDAPVSRGRKARPGKGDGVADESKDDGPADENKAE